jgi:hypothetical protein
MSPGGDDDKQECCDIICRRVNCWVRHGPEYYEREIERALRADITRVSGPDEDIVDIDARTKKMLVWIGSLPLSDQNEKITVIAKASGHSAYVDKIRTYKANLSGSEECHKSGM